MNVTEQLKEIQPEPRKLPEIPPCDIKYITVGYWYGNSNPFWSLEAHITLEQAQRECDDPSYAPDTTRIFEVPKERN